MTTPKQPTTSGPWDAALEQLRAWDQGWAEICTKMTTNPWNSGILPHKTVELIGPESTIPSRRGYVPCPKTNSLRARMPYKTR